MSDRPSFLFFITDQQRADWLGCYGHPVLKTPHIDAIAAKGTIFDRFHVASPVCMPNRASLMTGRYPTVHGLRYNGCLLPTSAVTFVDVLAAGGYHTASIGKSHLQPFSSREPLVPPRADPGAYEEAWRPAGEDQGQEEPERYTADGRYEFKTPYYGFQQVDMVTKHGDRCGGHYQQWFRERAPNWRELHDGANELAHNYSCPQAYRTPVPKELYPTAYVRERTIAYLNDRAGEDQPFFAFVSFPDPHHPFNPPGRYWDIYRPDDFEVGLPYAAHRNPTPPMRWLHRQWQEQSRQMTPETATMLGDEELRQAMALTAGMIGCIDDAVGAIVDCLKQRGLYENTVICFNSDHGDYLGDFNMLLKGAMPFQGITRVPFIWSDPESRAAKRTDALASTVDLPVSILERAGLVPYAGMQGMSFLACLDGASRLRDELLIEYNDSGPRLGFKTPSRVRALVGDRHRLTIYKGHGWGELYDLKTDPSETNNLWDSPAHTGVRAEMTLSLAHHLTGLMDESPKAHRLA
ncbi:MAG: sulfatase-like hydrolase/transferase [Alphaproteobacteria bacterium]|jgi:arylsulfatase A-like enzyme|nr:sulfatase-like hydrolase/transferase [Alphaproteobacteria bacterium]